MEGYKLYSKRFNDLEQRKKIWKTLVNYFFQKYIDKNDTVLDFGSGYCEFINNINSRTKYAVDSDPGFKSFAARNVKFIRNKNFKLDIPSNSVDKIFVSNVLEHLTREGIDSSIKEFHRMLKKGGLVLLLQPNIRFCPGEYWMFYDHITPIDDRALEEVFLANDFVLIQRILHFLPYTTKVKFPKFDLLVRIYLLIPLLWRLLGKQSFLVFEK